MCEIGDIAAEKPPIFVHKQNKKENYECVMKIKCSQLWSKESVSEWRGLANEKKETHLGGWISGEWHHPLFFLSHSTEEEEEEKKNEPFTIISLDDG